MTYIPLSKQKSVSTQENNPIQPTGGYIPLSKQKTSGYVPLSQVTPDTKPPIDTSMPATPAPAPKKQGFFSKVGQKVADAIDRPENKGQAGTTMKSQLPSSIVESLPFGIGAIFKGIHDMEQGGQGTDMQYFDNKDMIKALPGAVLDTAKGFIKAPISGALNVAGLVSNKKIKFNIPGLGKVSNATSKVAERIQNGDNPVAVALEEGSNAILDTLFFASIVSKPFVGRPITTAKSEIPADFYAKQPNAIKGVQPKSFRLYEQKTSAQQLSPQFIETAKSQGVDFGENFKPERPTYFRMTYEPKGNLFKGEIVQIRPSWISIIAKKFGGDIMKAPTQALEVISTPKEVKVKDIENAVKNPIVEQIPPETTNTPITPETPPITEPGAVQLTPEQKAQQITEPTPNTDMRVNNLLEIEPTKEQKKIEDLHTELKTAYQQYPEAEKELTNILASLDLAEAGKRIFNDSGVGTEVKGVPSSFPAWIPDNLRTKKSLDKLTEIIKDINSITYPTRSNAHSQRLLVNEMLSVLDSRLGIDTSGIRNDILKEYGKNQSIDNSNTGESKPAGRGNATADRTKIEEAKNTEIQDRIDRLQNEIDTRDSFDGKLSDKQVKQKEEELSQLVAEKFGETIYKIGDKVKDDNGNILTITAGNKPVTDYPAVLADNNIGFVRVKGEGDSQDYLYYTNRIEKITPENKKEKVQETTKEKPKTVKKTAEKEQVKTYNLDISDPDKIPKAIREIWKDFVNDKITKFEYEKNIKKLTKFLEVKIYKQYAEKYGDNSSVLVDIDKSPQTEKLSAGFYAKETDTVEFDEYDSVMEVVEELHSIQDTGNKYSKEIVDQMIGKPVKKEVGEFKVGDILDTKGGTNMKSPVTIREITGNTLKFTDAEGTDFSGMQRADVRRLVNEGAWKKVDMEQKLENINENRGVVFTKQEIENWNRNSHFSPDWNKDYQTSLDNVLEEARLKKIPEELKNDWDKFIELYTPEYKRFLDTRSDNPSSMYTGRANFNYKISNKLLGREEKIMQRMDFLRKDFLRKASVYQRNEYKKGGTAEERRQKVREQQDQNIKVGTRVRDFAFGAGTIERVNTKTYSIKFDSGSTYPRDKTFVQPINDLPKGSNNANIGIFADGTPVELGNMDKIRPIEFPELVDLAKELLSGKTPIVKRLAENKGGFFRPQPGKENIVLNADKFDNPEQMAKILAHEIGHLVDYLPEGTMARGNLIGRLKTLQGFMAETFGKESDALGEGKFSDQRRKEIKNRITREVLQEKGLKFGDLFGNKLSKPERAELNKEINTRTKAVIDEILTKEGYLKNKDIKKELMDASLYWRPLQKEEVMTNADGEIIFDEETGKPKYEIINIPLEKYPKSFQNYRKSSKELYADAISMLFNTPGTLEKMAPIFYKEFFDALDRKPTVFEAYFGLQELLGGDRNTLLERRRAGVRGMFDKGDMKASEIQKARLTEQEARRKNFLFKFKFDLIDKNYALIDRVNSLKKKGIKVNDDENPVYYLEERNYLGGKIKSFMESNIQPIYKNLMDSDISWTDFGEALFYDRIRAGDRSEVANPRGITPKVAEELLQKMFKDMGETKANIIVNEMENFRGALKTITEEAFNEGLYKQEMYDQMKANPAYSTFQVLDHLEEGMTSKIHKSIGTLKDIANPADASLLKGISTFRAIERNKVTRSVAEFLQKEFPLEIKEADYTRTPKGKIPKESKLPNQDLITYMKEGRRLGFYVDPYISKSVNNETIGSSIAIMRLMNSSLFRPLFITYNPGFQAFNLIRDFKRFWKNTPNMSLARSIKLYRDAMPVAKARAWGIKDNNEWGAEILKKMEKEQILSITYNQLTDSADVEEQQIKTILINSGIDSFKPEERNKFIKPFVDFLEAIKNVGDFIETLPKVAGYLEMTEGGLKDISKGDKSFIRRKIGSPDFLAGGYWKPVTNEVFLFSNSITQGIRSDYETATDPKTRSGYWYKTAKSNILPKVLMYLASLGLFGAYLKEIMDKASEYDKTNYTIIPLTIAGDGKGIYFRDPQDEAGRLMGGLAWKVLNAPTNKQGIGKDLIDIANFTGGQLPSVSPSITATIATGQYLAGQNPYDWFRNREVLTDDQMKAGGMYSLKPFAGWLFGQSGGSVFYKFNVGAPKDMTSTEKFLNLPFVGNILGRFLKVSDYGKTETLNEVKAEVQSDQAKRRLDEASIINDYIKKQQKLDDETAIDVVVKNEKAKLVNEILGHAPQNEEELARAKNIEKKFKIGLQRGESDPYINALISSVTNDEKVALMQGYKKTLTKQEFNRILLASLKYKIISPEVIIKLSTKEK